MYSGSKCQSRVALFCFHSNHSRATQKRRSSESQVHTRKLEILETKKKIGLERRQKNNKTNLLKAFFDCFSFTFSRWLALASPVPGLAAEQGWESKRSGANYYPKQSENNLGIGKLLSNSRKWAHLTLLPSGEFKTRVEMLWEMIAISHQRVSQAKKKH